MEYTRPRAKLVTLLGVLELRRWEEVWLAEVCLRIPSQLAKQNGKFPKTLLFNIRTRPCPLAYSRKGIIRSSGAWKTEFRHHSHRPATILVVISNRSSFFFLTDCLCQSVSFPNYIESW